MTVRIFVFLTALLVSIRAELEQYQFDPNGYVMFCLCMGRFGNQAEHFLGSMSFAKNINRTFIVPPFRTFQNVPYKKWFKLEKLNEFHRSISAEDFMKHIAPTYWPEAKRQGFCWGQQECQMHFGNPSNQFWDQLGVKNFTNSLNFDLDFTETDRWMSDYPAYKYPVIALKGAPATFPIRPEHRGNQEFMVWSDEINAQVEDYLKASFGDEKFIGIHLRNGPDWTNACSYLDKKEHLKGFSYFMASPQCVDNINTKLSRELCFPSTTQILDDLEKVIKSKLNNTVRNIYVATDKNPLIKEIEARFKGVIDKVVHYDPWLPVIDLAILGRSEYFIGNCLSSFTAFVKRERDINQRPSTFWTL